MKRPKNNRIILILSVFLIFLVMGAASANTEDITNNSISQNDVLTVDETVNDDTVSTNTDDELSNSAETNTLGAGTQSFTDLNNRIKDATENSTIELNGDYKYNSNTDSAFEYGVVITKNNITIDGLGKTTIDGNNLSRIFYVAEDVTSFTLKNIIMQNANSPGSGGALYFADTMKNVEISGTFINNTAPSNGVAYFAAGVSGNIKFNGIYENNQALTGNGGVVGFGTVRSGSNVYLNGKYNNNKAYNEIGAVQVGTLEEGASIFITGEFKNNIAQKLGTYGAGGVVYISDLNGNATLSGDFINNTGNTSGGVMFVYNELKGNLVLSGNFINNHGATGGILYVNPVVYGNVTLSGNFTGNNATGTGGVAYFNKNINGTVKLTGTFNDNYAPYGALMRVNNITGKVDLTQGTFKDNTADYSLIHVTDISGLENLTYNPRSFSGDTQVIGVSSSLSFITIPTSVYSDRGLFIKIRFTIGGVTNYTGMSVKLNITGHPTQILNLDEEGYANITFTDLTLGNNTVTIYYDGNDTINRASNTCNVTVNYAENTKSFSDLAYDLNRIPKDTVILDGLYVFDPSTDSQYVNGIELIRDITIIGNGAVIDAAGSARVLNVATNVHSFNLYNLTIKNGYAYGSKGGAIAFNGDLNNVNISGCTFHANTAVQDAGGAIAFMKSVNNAIIDSAFNYNRATYVEANDKLIAGGAIYFGDKVTSTTIKGKFYSNNVRNDRQTKGGAIYFRQAVYDSIIDANFTENYLTDVAQNSGDHFGGAICFQEKVVNTNVSGIFKSNRIVLNNGAYDYGSYQGGAISYRCGVDNSVIDANFTKNSAVAGNDWGIFPVTSKSGSGLGGAIHVVGVSNNLAIKGYFNENSADYGGAIYIGYQPRENYEPNMVLVLF